MPALAVQTPQHALHLGNSAIRAPNYDRTRAALFLRPFFTRHNCAGLRRDFPSSSWCCACSPESISKERPEQEVLPRDRKHRADPDGRLRRRCRHGGRHSHPDRRRQFPGGLCFARSGNRTCLHQMLMRCGMQPSMIGPGHPRPQPGTLIASAIFDPAPKVSLKDRNPLSRSCRCDERRSQTLHQHPGARPGHQ